jgi:hypothetical protein
MYGELRKGFRAVSWLTLPLADRRHRERREIACRRRIGLPVKDKGLGEVLAGTSYIFGTHGLVSGPSLKVDNLQWDGSARVSRTRAEVEPGLEPD